MEYAASPQSRETVVAPKREDLVFLWIIAPLLAAGGAWLVKLVAGWVSSLSWAPFRGLFELIASIPDPQATIGALTLGGLAGMAFAYYVVRSSLTVTVSDDRVTMARGRSSQGIERTSVNTVFLDGDDLVLLGRTTEELAREGSDMVDADRLTDAFLTHGFPWSADGDPHKHEYRRWVEDTPDLPEMANALFKARERALKKGNDGDVADLRAELAKMGIVVREEKKRQYWRRIEQPPESLG